MLDGKGYFKGSTVLVAGQAGTGKTSFGAEVGSAGMYERQESAVHQFRRISVPDNSEHEVDRNRPRTVHREGLVTDTRRSADIVRSGDASGHDTKDGEAVRTGCRHPRSHYQ